MNDNMEIIKKWLEKGDEDLGTALIIQKHIPEYRHVIAFHCQQAVEKYLKGYLIYLKIEFRRTHDLVYLLELINDKESIDENMIENIMELADYAVEIRYPETTIELTEAEINNAIIIAKSIRDFVHIKMDITSEFN